jgi:hypothetical protein
MKHFELANAVDKAGPLGIIKFDNASKNRVGRSAGLGKHLKHKFAIVGLGLLAGRYPENSLRALQSEAARIAIEDAGLDPAQVNGAIDLRLAPGSGEVPSETDGFPRMLGLPCKTFFQIGRGGTGGIMSIVAAAKFLEIGAADYIVVAFGCKDWSRTRGPHRSNIRSIEKSGYWAKPFGDVMAASHHTFFASRHMYEYGTPPEASGTRHLLPTGNRRAIHLAKIPILCRPPLSFSIIGLSRWYLAPRESTEP